MATGPDGVLILDKPQGPTSFDVVRRVRSLLKVKKVGHTGTLDPMATGVLPVCLGEGTKLAGLLTEGDKAYDAVVRLGQETDTQDAEGRVTAEAPVPPLTAERVEAALARFRGTYPQVPPMYSAVKINGKRLYELAREGEEVERAPRTVTVHALVLRDFSATELHLSVRSSKGFFVRTLAHELGRALGCGAHLKALRRTHAGPFTLAQAVPLARVEALVLEGGAAALAPHLVPLGRAVEHLPALRLDARSAERVKHGVPLEVPPGDAPAAGPGAPVRLLGPEDRLLALAEVVAGRLRYLRVFA